MKKKVGAISQADINNLSAQIYNQARKGSAINMSGLPVTLANLVVAQARHETGNFSSNSFRKHNNAFGYAYVSGGKYQMGPGLVADNGQPVANYASVEHSVMELVDWIYRRRKEGKFPALETIKDPAQYAKLLKSAGYYGDTLQNYLTGLKSFFKEIVPGSGSLGMGLVIAGVTLAYIYRRDLFSGPW